MVLTPHFQLRKDVAQAKRVVIKLGTRVLVQANGRPNRKRMGAIAHQAALLRRAGRDVIIVSSGAVGVGIDALGMTKRPTDLADLQMAAAVGQSRLMARYDSLFQKEKCPIGQVLLTHSDLKHRKRHLNARNTMLNLLRHGVIPIVNENDTVSVDEIKVGDNDVMAALVSILVDADALLLMTSADGLREPNGAGKTKRVPYIPKLNKTILGLTHGKGSDLSTGGMASKLEAANMFCRTGGISLILDGRKPSQIEAALAGGDNGTLMAPDSSARTTRRKNWITFFNRSTGSIHIDSGAVKALKANGKSLLPIGVKRVDGKFDIGSMVEIVAPNKAVIARGLTNYSSQEIDQIKGCQSSEIAKQLGNRNSDVIVHRDNLVLED